MDFDGIVNYVSIEVSIKDLLELGEYDFIEKATEILKEINGEDWCFESDDDISDFTISIDDVSPCKTKVTLKVRGNLYNNDTDDYYTLIHGRIMRVSD